MGIDFDSVEIILNLAGGGIGCEMFKFFEENHSVVKRLSWCDYAVRHVLF